MKIDLVNGNFVLKIETLGAYSTLTIENSDVDEKPEACNLKVGDEVTTPNNSHARILGFHDDWAWIVTKLGSYYTVETLNLKRKLK